MPFCFYRTWVHSLSSLVTNWLTARCLQNLMWPWRMKNLHWRCHLKNCWCCYCYYWSYCWGSSGHFRIFWIFSGGTKYFLNIPDTKQKLSRFAKTFWSALLTRRRGFSDFVKALITNAILFIFLKWKMTSVLNWLPGHFSWVSPLRKATYLTGNEHFLLETLNYKQTKIIKRISVLHICIAISFKIHLWWGWSMKTLSKTQRDQAMVTLTNAVNISNFKIYMS